MDDRTTQYEQVVQANRLKDEERERVLKEIHRDLAQRRRHHEPELSPLDEWVQSAYRDRNFLSKFRIP